MLTSQKVATASQNSGEKHRGPSIRQRTLDRCSHLLLFYQSVSDMQLHLFCILNSCSYSPMPFSFFSAATELLQLQLPAEHLWCLLLQLLPELSSLIQPWLLTAWLSWKPLAPFCCAHRLKILRGSQLPVMPAIALMTCQ